MANRTENGRFAPGVSGNPSGRPKLPAEMKEMFQAKATEAFEVLCKHLHANDSKVSVTAAREILDRAYGRPVQSIDANIAEETVRYVAEVPAPVESTQEWLEGCKPYIKRSLVSGAAAVDDEQKQH